MWFINTTFPEQSPNLILLVSRRDIDDTNKSRSLRDSLSGCGGRCINLISSCLRCAIIEMYTRWAGGTVGEVSRSIREEVKLWNHVMKD